MKRKYGEEKNIKQFAYHAIRPLIDFENNVNLVIKVL